MQRKLQRHIINHTHLSRHHTHLFQQSYLHQVGSDSQEQSKRSFYSRGKALGP